MLLLCILYSFRSRSTLYFHVHHKSNEYICTYVRLAYFNDRLSTSGQNRSMYVCVRCVMHNPCTTKANFIQHKYILWEMCELYAGIVRNVPMLIVRYKKAILVFLSSYTYVFFFWYKKKENFN